MVKWGVKTLKCITRNEIPQKGNEVVELRWVCVTNERLQVTRRMRMRIKNCFSFKRKYYILNTIQNAMAFAVKDINISPLFFCHSLKIIELVFVPRQYHLQLSHVRKRNKWWQDIRTQMLALLYSFLLFFSYFSLLCIFYFYFWLPYAYFHSTHCTHMCRLLNLNNFCLLQCFQWKNIFCSAKWRRGKSSILFGSFLDCSFFLPLQIFIEFE